MMIALVVKERFVKQAGAYLDAMTTAIVHWVKPAKREGVSRVVMPMLTAHWTEPAKLVSVSMKSASGMIALWLVRSTYFVVPDATAISDKGVVEMVYPGDCVWLVIKWLRVSVVLAYVSGRPPDAPARAIETAPAEANIVTAPTDAFETASVRAVKPALMRISLKTKLVAAAVVRVQTSVA